MPTQKELEQAFHIGKLELENADIIERALHDLGNAALCPTDPLSEAKEAGWRKAAEEANKPH